MRGQPLGENASKLRMSLWPRAAGDTALAFRCHRRGEAGCRPARIARRGLPTVSARGGRKRLRPSSARATSGASRHFARCWPASSGPKYEDFDREMGVFRRSRYCVERVQAAAPRIRDGRVSSAYFNQGGSWDHAMVRQSMTSFRPRGDAALPLASGSILYPRR